MRLLLRVLVLTVGSAGVLWIALKHDRGHRKFMQSLTLFLQILHNELEIRSTELNHSKAKISCSVCGVRSLM